MVKVSESTRLHTVVSKLQARTFPDRRIITYALLSENLKTPTIFEINSRTGEIILSKRPDIREMRTFLLEIEASSFDGKKHRSAKAFVLINFSKVQSRGGSLSFTRSSFYIKVPCNTPLNTTVYRAQTKNTGRGGSTRISFLRKLDHFSITGGGKIKIQRSLLPFCDVTPSKKFRTSVAARDTSGTKRNAHALLQIEITPPIRLPQGNAGSRSYLWKNLFHQTVPKRWFSVAREMVTTEWKQLHCGFHWISSQEVVYRLVTTESMSTWQNNHEKAPMLTTTQYEKSANVEILFNSTYLRDSAIKLW